MIEVPECPKCGTKTYMIHRMYVLEIETNPNPWMCIKCTHEKHAEEPNYLTVEMKNEILHLEGKIPYFECEGDKLVLNKETRRYNKL